MAKAYGDDLRRKFFEAYDEGGATAYDEGGATLEQWRSVLWVSLGFSPENATACFRLALGGIR